MVSTRQPAIHISYHTVTVSYDDTYLPTYQPQRGWNTLSFLIRYQRQICNFKMITWFLLNFKTIVKYENIFVLVSR